MLCEDCGPSPVRRIAYVLSAGPGRCDVEAVCQSFVGYHLLENEFRHGAAAYVAVADEQNPDPTYAHAIRMAEGVNKLCKMPYIDRADSAVMDQKHSYKPTTLDKFVNLLPFIAFVVIVAAGVVLAL